MACFYPITAYKSKDINPETGKRSLVFNIKNAYDDQTVTINCGQCIGCRLERSRQWAVRCVHEAAVHEKNCFITLTYDEAHLPKDNSLDLRDFQLFMKRLRKKYKQKIRFFHCGEYGENFGRPHYHACLFNFDFDDKILFKNIKGNNLYLSEELSKLWPFGFSTIGDVTFESAAYVARYITKKVTGEKAFEHYNKIDYETGELLQERKPEYITMSRRPGIGKPWLDKFMKDVYPSDFIVMNGKKLKPPRFYDNKHELTYPYEHEDIIFERRKKKLKIIQDNSYDRLRVKEKIQNERFKQLIRTIK